MGKQDNATREYIRDTNVFSDVFNYYIFGGKKVIKAQSLQEMDTSALLRIIGKNGKKKDVQRYRDALKKATLMIGDKAAYIVFGLEAQTHIDYGMPIRTFVYDGLQYDSQAKAIKEAHIANGDKPDKDEFVSGLYKNDRILPVITVIVYFGSKPWDGATRLRDLYECDSPEILDLAPDYKMHLIDPTRMTEEDFDKFSTDMGKVLKFMKVSGDRDEMYKLIKADKSYKNLSRKAAEVLRECAKVPINTDKRKDVVDLCKAWDDHARECTILSAIDTARRYSIKDNIILADIMTQFGLTKREAKAYMAKKSA